MSLLEKICVKTFVLEFKPQRIVKDSLNKGLWLAACFFVYMHWCELGSCSFIFCVSRAI